MEHLDFIVWMCAFPIARSLCLMIEGIYESDEPPVGDGVKTGAAAIVLGIYACIGFILY